jgi:hypothetical protein
MHVYFISEDGEPWVIGKLLALQADGSRVFVFPQLLRIQRALQAFLKHRRCRAG